MLIKIVAGVFGHQTPNGRVVLIKTGEVVEVTDNVGKRLIASGCAVEAELAEQHEEDVGEQVNESSTPKYNIYMSRDELEKIGEEFYGIDPEDMANLKNKGELIALLDEAKAEYEEAVPSLNAADAIVQ